MYEKILLAIAVLPLTAHGQAAKEAATVWAKGSGGSIHLLTVYEYSDERRMVAVGVPSELDTVAVGVGNTSVSDPEELDETIDRRLDELAREIHANGIKVTVDKVVGEPNEEIVRAANQIEADLIVIGSHHKRNILDIGLGSHARAVARSAPCTVIIVNPN